jgi:hypothetical protein
MTLEQALQFHSTGLEEADEPTPSYGRRLGAIFIVLTAVTLIGLVGVSRHRSHGAAESFD